MEKCSLIHPILLVFAYLSKDTDDSNEFPPPGISTHVYLPLLLRIRVLHIGTGEIVLWKNIYFLWACDEVSKIDNDATHFADKMHAVHS